MIKDRGFSLIELLVVIAAIALVMSLLLPAVSRSKETAKSARCLSNLRQMAIAAHIYVNDYSGAYPIAYYQNVQNGVVHSCNWDWTTIAGSPDRVIPGLLWQGQDAEKIQQCPSFTGRANWLSDPHTGYNYNTSYIGHGQGENIPEPARAAAVRKPAATVLFGDGQYSAGANKFMRAPWPNPGDESFNARWAGTTRAHG